MSPASASCCLPSMARHYRGGDLLLAEHGSALPGRRPAAACRAWLGTTGVLRGHGGSAPDPPTDPRKSWLRHAYRKPSPVAAGRPLGKIKEEAAWRPGDICIRGLPAAAGPIRSRVARNGDTHPISHTSPTLSVNARSVVLIRRRLLQQTTPDQSGEEQKNGPGHPGPLACLTRNEAVLTRSAGPASTGARNAPAVRRRTASGHGRPSG